MQELRTALHDLTIEDVNKVLEEQSRNLLQVKMGKVKNFRHDAFFGTGFYKRGGEKFQARRPDLRTLHSSGRVVF